MSKFKTWILREVLMINGRPGRTKAKMIKAILVFNNHGKPRMTKFYEYYVSAHLYVYLFMSLD